MSTKPITQEPNKQCLFSEVSLNLKLEELKEICARPFRTYLGYAQNYLNNSPIPLYAVEWDLNNAFSAITSCARIFHGVLLSTCTSVDTMNQATVIYDKFSAELKAEYEAVKKQLIAAQEAQEA